VEPIPHNRWDTLDVPALGAWTPSLRVTVVIPYYRQRDALELTLTGLAAQTYPSDLLEVIVVDDGSEEPLSLPERHLGLDVTVLRQERAGFGAPRARNLGAAHARGELLLFLDADMIPEPGCVEAHARWHHVCDYAVTLGPRTHVDAAGIDATAVRSAARGGELAPVFDGRDRFTPTWIDEHLRRTGGLTGADDDLFRVVASGNLGVGAALFDRVGGFDASFDQWGGEDTELGYRLFVAGGLLVHDPQAHCWHQGDGHEPDADERLSLVEQRPRLAQVIAHHGFRRIRRGRTYRIPRVTATVDAADADAGAALATVESLLASSLPDLCVRVVAPADDQHRRWLQRQFEADARVGFDIADVHWTTPYRLHLDAGTTVGMETVEQVVAALGDPREPIGVLYATVPPARPGERRLVAWSSRAVQRVLAAERPADHPQAGIDPDDVLVARAAEVFGRVWRSGDELGVGEASTLDPLADPDAGRTAVAVRGELQALGEVLARLEPGQQQQLVEVARTGLTQLGPRRLRFLLGVARRGLRALAWFGRLRPGGRARR
jgi:GT2 family glycosyltransferase